MENGRVYGRGEESDKMASAPLPTRAGVIESGQITDHLCGLAHENLSRVTDIAGQIEMAIDRLVGCEPQEPSKTHAGEEDAPCGALNVLLQTEFAMARRLNRLREQADRLDRLA